MYSSTSLVPKDKNQKTRGFLWWVLAVAGPRGINYWDKSDLVSNLSVLESNKNPINNLPKLWSSCSRVLTPPWRRVICSTVAWPLPIPHILDIVNVTINLYQNLYEKYPWMPIPSRESYWVPCSICQASYVAICSFHFLSSFQDTWTNSPCSKNMQNVTHP